MKKHKKRNLELLKNDEKINQVEGKDERKKPTEKKRNREKGSNVDISKAVRISVEAGNSIKGAKENKKNNPRKKRKSEEKNNALVEKFVQLGTDIEDGHQEQNGAKEKKRNKSRKKRKSEEKNNAPVGKFDQLGTDTEDGLLEQNGAKEMKKNKSRKKKKSEEKNNALVGKYDQLGADGEDGLKEQNDDEVPHHSQLSEIHNSIEADDGTEIRTCKSKKARKKKKKDTHSLMEDEKLPEKTTEAIQNEVYYISSGDEDCSKGFKKWVTEYYQSRPGLKVLQQRIDDFMTAHEERLEEERKEREAKAAEGGWTVVVHHKGRKKTTDSESGITVGSVAQAVVEDKMGKKNRKEVGIDFYRFQKREAHRNEIMTLQSKFEQDRKRIQQLRAARKFRPY